MKKEIITPEENITVRSLVRTPFNYYFVVDLPENYSVAEARETRAKFEAAPELYKALDELLFEYEQLAQAKYGNYVFATVWKNAKAAMEKANQ